MFRRLLKLEIPGHAWDDSLVLRSGSWLEFRGNATKYTITCRRASSIHSIRHAYMDDIDVSFVLPDNSQTLAVDMNGQNSIRMHVGQSTLRSLFAFVSFVDG